MRRFRSEGIDFLYLILWSSALQASCIVVRTWTSKRRSRNCAYSGNAFLSSPTWRSRWNPLYPNVSSVLSIFSILFDSPKTRKLLRKIRTTMSTSLSYKQIIRRPTMSVMYCLISYGVLACSKRVWYFNENLRMHSSRSFNRETTVGFTRSSTRETSDESSERKKSSASRSS